MLMTNTEFNLMLTFGGEEKGHNEGRLFKGFQWLVIFYFLSCIMNVWVQIWDLLVAVVFPLQIFKIFLKIYNI